MLVHAAARRGLSVLPRRGTRYPAKETLLNTANLLAETAEAGRIPMVFVKGLSVQELYPDGILRQQADIDVAVPSLDLCWRLVSRACALGFSIGVLAIRAGDQNVYDANVSLLPPDGFPPIEIWARSQPISPSIAFALPEATWKVAFHSIENSLPFPPLNLRLLILAGDCVEAGKVSVRDCMDFAFILRTLSRSAIAELANIVAEQDSRFLSRTLCKIARGVSRIPRLSDLCTSNSRGLIAALAENSRDSRAEYEIGSGGRSISKAASVKTSCGLLPLSSMLRGAYVRFLHVAESSSGPLACAINDCGCFLRTPLGLFVSEDNAVALAATTRG